MLPYIASPFFTLFVFFILVPINSKFFLFIGPFNH